VSKVLIIVGDGAEVIDTMVPYYRLGEDHETVVAAPAVRTYHMVQHHHRDDWDILPGGRAPEFLRYDNELLHIVRHFFEEGKPVASICHGIEILAAADVIRGKRVTTIPRCQIDA
jgi:protease I